MPLTINSSRFTVIATLTITLALALPNIGSAVTYPATPFISPASGTYTSGRTVTISDATSGTKIYFTRDGSTPSKSSPVYTGPIAIPAAPAAVTIRAIAVSGELSSSGARTDYTIAPTLMAPAFSPAQGNYSAAQSVTISSPMAGGVIHYTTDSSTPTASSPVYSGPIAVTGYSSIAAVISGVPGYSPSIMIRQNYGIFPATPYISPAGGTFTSGRNVTISDNTPGAVIHFTTDGSTPTNSSPVYSGTMAIDGSPQTKIVKAVAFANNLTSSVASASYTIAPMLPPPSFAPPQGSYSSAQQVTISASAPGGTVHYTIDGSTPTVNSPVYSGPVTVSNQESIAAIVSDLPGYSPSQIIRQNYTVAGGAATPVMSPAGGTFSGSITVSLSDSTKGAAIYYTTDGSNPTSGSVLYTAPLNLSATATVKAIAIASGYRNSPAASSWYGIQTPTPAIRPASGTYASPQMVTLTDASSTAAIYYTTDGSKPTASSTLYTGPFLLPNLPATENIQVVAISGGHEPSQVAQASITLGVPDAVLATAVLSTSQPNPPIPSNFLGLSHEWSAAQSMMGSAVLGVNHSYRNLVGLLSTNMNGPIVVRVGGVSTDKTEAPTSTTIQPFEELAQALNVRFVLGINFGKGDLKLAQSQAANYLLNDTKQAIDALEIGNEPDLYSSNGLRSPSYGYASFLPEYQQWVSGISNGTALPVTVAGPAFSGSAWVPNAQSDFSKPAAATAIVTQHKYLTGYDPNNPLPSNYLLQPSSSTSSVSMLASYAAAVHATGAKFRVGEFNSISLGGQPGLSNSFSSALWSIDAMFELVKAGVDGVNWHSNYAGGPYDLFKFGIWQSNGINMFTLESVRPLYYGLLFFSQAAGNHAHLLPLSTTTSSNVKTWATADVNGNAHVVIINKEPSASGKVRVTLPGYSKGQVVRLNASSYQATSGVTIGGQTFDGSPDGSLQGSPSPESIVPVNGVWTINVDAASAVLMNLQP